jgi:DNA-binding NarL/FixJ family response regulator
MAQLVTGLDDDVSTIDVALVKDAMAALESAPFDVVLVDLDMPGIDDTALAGLIRAAKRARLVGLSNEMNPAAVRRAIDAGCAGYLPKSARADVILAALRIVLSGERYAPVAEAVYDATTPAGDQSNEQPRRRLTRRQHDIIRLLAEGKQNRDIAAALGVAEGTVKVHLANIFRALKVTNRTAAAAAAHKLGLLG